MPVIGLRSSFFDALEDALSVPDVILDYQPELDMLIEGNLAADPTVLQLSSSLIRIQMPLEDWFSGQITNYELRISGTGIGPVSSLRALVRAIDQGFATGTITKFEAITGGDTIFQITLGTGGYEFSSGDQWIRIDGDLPLSFTQMADFADLFNQANSIDLMTDAERAQLFDDMSQYGVSGLSFGDGATELFGFSVSATKISLSLNGLTFSARGTFPDNLGEDLDTLWNMASQLEDTGTIDPTQLDGLSMSSIRITDPAGRVMGTIYNPLNGTDPVWRVDGRTYDEIKIDMDGRDVLTGGAGDVRSVLAGLDGNDLILGGGANDLLLGGTGNDTLNGEAGIDRLSGGLGRDVLTGGSQVDTFVFLPGGGLDIITDFTVGPDLIEIRTADSLADLQFTDTGRNVRIDFNSIHIVVANIEISELAILPNFVF